MIDFIDIYDIPDDDDNKNDDFYLEVLQYFKLIVIMILYHNKQ